MIQIIAVWHSLPDNRSNFVILFKVALLPAVCNTQGGGIEEILTTAPADSAQHVWDYMNIVYSAAECAYTVDRSCFSRKETSHLFQRITFFVENLVGAAVRSQSGQRPTEEWKYSHTVCAWKFGPVFGALHSHRPEQWEVGATVHHLVLETTGRK